jgi:uncharacterized protein (DUF924 family)
VSTFDDVLGFWFVETPVGPKQIKKLSPRWFAADPAFDAKIEKRFDDEMQKARAGELDEWCASARGRLALVLMLDQFYRCAHRGTSGAFQGDEKALKLCRQGIGEGADRALPVVERAFFYLPLMHAEELSAQLAAVRLYEGLLKESAEEHHPVLKEFLAQARVHHDVINRFGRFPQRNEILRREPLPDETLFLRRRSSKLALGD